MRKEIGGRIGWIEIRSPTWGEMRRVARADSHDVVDVSLSWITGWGLEGTPPPAEDPSVVDSLPLEEVIQLIVGVNEALSSVLDQAIPKSPSR